MRIYFILWTMYGMINHLNKVFKIFKRKNKVLSPTIYKKQLAKF